MTASPALVTVMETLTETLTETVTPMATVILMEMGTLIAMEMATGMVVTRGAPAGLLGEVRGRSAGCWVS